MPRRVLLSPAQREELLVFPTEEADLLRHYTFNTHDPAVIRRRRGVGARASGSTGSLSETVLR
jgi:hypothetical protein